MPMRIKEAAGARRFVTPVMLVVALLGIHWVLSDWSALPRLISSTLASMR